MKNVLKSLSILSLIAFSAILSSCGNDSTHGDHITENLTLIKCEDNYRTMYQIFPYSFSDSNGDGIGDIKGIIDKLDYISNLGYNGLWLTPVHKSDSYHKYDVDDYKTIDPKFGSLEDYDNLVTKCHEKGMTILLDLVLNHTSDSNEWFTKCIYDHLRNKTTDQYYNYYNVIKLAAGSPVPVGYTQSGELAYESRFWSGMPDLNLQNVLDEPNGYLANDIKSILEFWLIDHNVDGFRLDAVTSYFTNDTERNKQFLTWLNNETKKIKPSAYIVGEGSWNSPNENKIYYSSGCDGFFMFEDALSDGYICQSVSRKDATYYSYAINKNLEEVSGTSGIPAVFVANHDTGRLVGSVSGKKDSSRVKLAQGVLEMMNGCTYNYYGDEIGMAVSPQANGATTIKDEDKRQPMNWGDSYTCKPVAGSTICDDIDKYPFPTVKAQLNDSNSIVNYVKKANLVRNSFMEITHGTAEKIYSNNDDSFCVVKREYKNSSVLVLINASNLNYQNYSLASSSYKNVLASLCAAEGSYVGYLSNSDEVVVPPMGIAIVK
jgi:alpha-amylase